MESNGILGKRKYLEKEEGKEEQNGRKLKKEKGVKEIAATLRKTSRKYKPFKYS